MTNFEKYYKGCKNDESLVIELKEEIINNVEFTNIKSKEEFIKFMLKECDCKYYVSDVARMLGVTRQSVHYWCKNGLIEYNVLASGKKWFTYEQIENFKNGKTK